jgi:predicted metalloprotease
MRIDELPRSENVEDRRGQDAGRGGFRIPGGRSGLGVGTIILLGLIGWWLGIDPSLLINGTDILIGGGPGQQQTREAPTSDTRAGAPSDQTGQFVSAVLGSTEVQWRKIFEEYGKTYDPPTLVMFSGITRSACGYAQSAVGPFYCPNDRKVYLDTSFFTDLERRFRACDAGGRACQFSQAYVITHEVGHHVQNLLGILPRAQAMQQRLDKAEANHVQVRVELQADCLAGVWSNHAEETWKFIEPGDIEAAMQTASARR